LSGQKPRTYTRVALGILVGAIIVAAAIAASVPGGVTHTKTLTDLSTTVVTTTTTVVSTETGGSTPITYTTTITDVATTDLTVTAPTTPPPGGRLYDVIFKQSGACTPTVYAAPWSVMLGPWTVAEPPNATLPISTTYGSATPSYMNDSMIIFAVPNGQYPYNVTMGWSVGNPTGTVSVEGADVMVLVQGPQVSCTAESTMG
jgi:hypothetical protein